MSLLLWVIIIVFFLNVIGYVSIPTYATGRYYLSLPVIVVIILILYLLHII